MWTFFEYETYLTAVADLMDHPAVRAMERLPQIVEGLSLCTGCFTGKYPLDPPAEDIRGEYIR